MAKQQDLTRGGRAYICHFRLILFYVYQCFIYIHVCEPCSHLTSISRGSGEGGSHPLELELPIVVKTPRGSGDCTRVLCKSSTVSHRAVSCPGRRQNPYNCPDEGSHLTIFLLRLLPTLPEILLTLLQQSNKDTREKPQWLGVLVALSKYLGSMPSAYMKVHKHC